MSDTATLRQTALQEDEHYLVTKVESGSESHRGVSPSQSTFFNRMLGRAELVLLPMSVAASLGAPAIGTEYFRTILRSKASGVMLEPVEWSADAWIYTEEPAALEEILSLNALLALPAPEGMWIDLDDE